MQLTEETSLQAIQNPGKRRAWWDSTGSNSVLWVMPREPHRGNLAWIRATGGDPGWRAESQLSLLTHGSLFSPRNIRVLVSSTWKGFPFSRTGWINLIEPSRGSTRWADIVYTKRQKSNWSVYSTVRWMGCKCLDACCWYMPPPKVPAVYIRARRWLLGFY